MRLLLIFIVFLFFSCRSEKRYEDLNLTDYQKQVNNYFKDASVSPLKPTDLKNFFRVLNSGTIFANYPFKYQKMKKVFDDFI